MIVTHTEDEQRAERRRIQRRKPETLLERLRYVAANGGHWLTAQDAETKSGSGYRLEWEMIEEEIQRRLKKMGYSKTTLLRKLRQIAISHGYWLYAKEGGAEYQAAWDATAKKILQRLNTARATTA